MSRQQIHSPRGWPSLFTRRLVLAVMILGFGLVPAGLRSGASESPREVRIIAHRGASWDAPENTIAAFKLGWEQGADAVELDVFLTADGHIVAIHDRDTERITGTSLVVAESSLEQLRQLDAGAWKDEQWAGERIPTLPEVFAIVAPGGHLLVELKTGPEIVAPLVEVFEASGLEAGQLTVIAFNHDTITEAKRQLPEVTCHWLVSSRAQPGTDEPAPVGWMIERALEAGSDGLNIHHGFPIDRGFVRQVHEAGLALYVWTVNDLPTARALVEAGVDGITTDRPAFLREGLGLAEKE